MRYRGWINRIVIIFYYVFARLFRCRIQNWRIVFCEKKFRKCLFSFGICVSDVRASSCSVYSSSWPQLPRYVTAILPKYFNNSRPIYCRYRARYVQVSLVDFRWMYVMLRKNRVANKSVSVLLRNVETSTVYVVLKNKILLGINIDQVRYVESFGMYVMLKKKLCEERDLCRIWYRY